MSKLFKMTPAAATERPSAGEADPRVATAPSRCSLTEDPGRTLSSQPQERGAELETVRAERSRRPVIPSLDSPPGEHDWARPVARHGFPQKSSVAAGRACQVCALAHAAAEVIIKSYGDGL